MNGFSNDWFGSAGLRTQGVGVGDVPEAPRPMGGFTPWAHGAAMAQPAAPPASRLQMPAFGPAHSLAPMSGTNPGFLGAVRLARQG